MTTNTYAKFIESDVYVLLTTNPKSLYCCACSIIQDINSVGYTAYNTKDMIDHLKEHEAVLDTVPSDIYKRLLDDDKQNFG